MLEILVGDAAERIERPVAALDAAVVRRVQQRAIHRPEVELQPRRVVAVIDRVDARNADVADVEDFRRRDALRHVLIDATHLEVLVVLRPAAAGNDRPVVAERVLDLPEHRPVTRVDLAVRGHLLRIAGSAQDQRTRHGLERVPDHVEVVRADLPRPGRLLAGQAQLLRPLVVVVDGVVRENSRSRRRNPRCRTCPS